MKEVQIRNVVKQIVREEFKQLISEESYDLGKKSYTDKNMTPTEILDLAMAYSKIPANQMLKGKLGNMVNVANDLAKLTGTTQLDAKTRGKNPALIVHLLKNQLVSKDEYVDLYKELITKQISVIKSLKNADPASRMVGGAAARQAHKDMKGEFEESVNEEGEESSPEQTLAGLKEMAMGDLERIADYAEMIFDRMDEGQELDSWMYSQITLAVDQLNSVHDAMDGIDGVKESVNEEKPGLWANIRAKRARGEAPAPKNSQAYKDAVKAGKEINKDESVNEMSVNDVHFKEILRMYDHGGSFSKKKVGAVVCKNPKASRKNIIDAMLDMDYNEITDVQDELGIKESVQGDKIQNLNNRIKALRDKISATKSPEQKNKLQNTLKNALQRISDIRKGQTESVNEGKPDYEVYHKTYTSAIQAGLDYAKKEGYDYDEEEAAREIGMGPRKPSEGKTNKFHLSLKKNFKEQKKMLHIQVYGMKNSYELNAYIQ
jgi:hypothetical protein